MLTASQYCNAMSQRVSRRAYLQQPMDRATAARVCAAVDEANQSSGLSFQFVQEGEAALSAVASKGMISGSPAYIALVGPDSPVGRDASGYYGEQLMLECVALGLGTCWVAGSYKKEAVLSRVVPGEGQALFGVIALGHCPAVQTAKEKLLSRAIHKKQTSYIQMMEQGGDPLPPALEQALKALEQAPSARNLHSPRLSYKNGVLSAWVEQPSSVQGLDLGIAKFHIQMKLEARGITARWDTQSQLIFVSQ